MRDKSLPSLPRGGHQHKDHRRPRLHQERTARGFRIGALAKLADIAASETVKEEYGLLAEAVHSVASPHVKEHGHHGRKPGPGRHGAGITGIPARSAGPSSAFGKGARSAAPSRATTAIIPSSAPPLSTEYPCSSHCPAKTDIPGYMDRIKKGDLAGAARILMEYNPIPAVTGRVCPVFCEPECNRQEFDEAVAIQCVERGVGDYVLENAGSLLCPARKRDGQEGRRRGIGPGRPRRRLLLEKGGPRGHGL